MEKRKAKEVKTMVELLRKEASITTQVVPLKNDDGSDYVQFVSYQTYLAMQKQPSFFKMWHVQDDSCLTDTQRKSINTMAEKAKLANMSPEERREAQLIEKLKRQGVIK